MTKTFWTPAGIARLVPDRLSTGTKLLLILTVALLPLGLIALFASIQSAQSKQAQRETDAHVIATAEARQIDILLLRGSTLIRTGLSARMRDRQRCDALQDRATSILGPGTHFAVFDGDGHALCATDDFDVGSEPPPALPAGLELRASEAPKGLRFVVAGPGGRYGVGELPTPLLQRVLAIGNTKQGIRLGSGPAALLISEAPEPGLFDRHVTVRAPVAGGQTMLTLELVSNPVTATEILLVLLPLLMWGAAAAIGWVVADQLLLRPLAQLQRAVAACGTTGQPLSMPRLTTPAREIKDLGEAFATTTAQLVKREAELEQGLEHQVRLTREVHHRVKNNLQVVASLINLHSRGTAGDVAAAYASIQRRVDALAVVHRNHYAELEENRGVALRSIVAELAGNLRGGVEPGMPQLAITLDMVPAYVTQDVAVPVAFLLTEIVELVMACDPAGSIAITLAPDTAPDRAVFTIAAPGLTHDACRDYPSMVRFQRIVTGLARQLRAPLDYDAERGIYSITLNAVPQR
ncbi:sensor histidine kinase [Sphingomonas sp.]|uniref:sensor histidine kinase n=1 Tax=Sphingomonas sp. TaxID=28214 RepID=UPI003B3BABB7